MLKERVGSIFDSFADRRYRQVGRKSAADRASCQRQHELQEDFFTNQGLALYLIDTLATLDPEIQRIALSASGLVESILEIPPTFTALLDTNSKTESSSRESRGRQL